MIHPARRVQVAGVVAALAVVAAPTAAAADPNSEISLRYRNPDDTVCYEQAPPVGSTGSAEPCAVTIELSDPLREPVRVQFATVDGTAVAPGDYEPFAGEVVIPPGLLTVQVPLPIRPDDEPEPDEWFYATISSPSVGRTGVDRLRVTIRDGAPPACG